MKITIKRTSAIELTAGRNWGWNSKCSVALGSGEDTEEGILTTDINNNYKIKIGTESFSDQTYKAMKIELNGIDTILAEIEAAIKVKEDEKEKAKAQAMQKAMADAYDQSVLINDLKPEIEKLGYKVAVNMTKEEYVKDKHNRIRLIINDGQYEGGFIPYNGNFEAIKNAPWPNRIEKTTKSMKIAKMLDAFKTVVIIDKREQKNKKEDADKASSDQEKLQQALGIEIVRESTEHYPRDHKGRTTGSSYMIHTYRPKENTKITVGVREKYNYETQEKYDEYSINLPQIISRDPELIKEIYDFMKKYF